MPFDFKKYDAKCAAMDQDALQREWEHYTRLISGAATSTAVSGAAVPFTFGVSAIGVGFSAPAIHNARKKREIIDKHLRNLGATHSTRKRDVLTPVAVSGTVGLLTLGCCHAGTDAIVNKAAEHSIAYIAENEVAVKVGTHLALETVAVSAEEAHASHKKEKESLKAYTKLIEAGKIPYPSPGPNHTGLSPSLSQYNAAARVYSNDASHPLTPSVSLSPPPQYPGLSNSVPGSYFPPPPGSAQSIQSNFAYPPSPVYTPDGKFPAVFNEAICDYKDPFVRNPVTPFTPLSPADLPHSQSASAEHKVPGSHIPITTVTAAWHGTQPCEVDNVVATFSTLRVSQEIPLGQEHLVSADTHPWAYLHKPNSVVQTPMPESALPTTPPSQDPTKIYFPPPPSSQLSQQTDCTAFHSIVPQQVQNTYEPQYPPIISYDPVPAHHPYESRPVQPQRYRNQPSLSFDQPVFRTSNMTQYFPPSDALSLSPSGMPHIHSQPQPSVQQIPREYDIHQQHNDSSHNHQCHGILPADPPLTGIILPAEYNPTSYNPTSYNPVGYNPASYDPSTYSVPAYNPAMYAQQRSQN